MIIACAQCPANALVEDGRGSLRPMASAPSPIRGGLVAELRAFRTLLLWQAELSNTAPGRSTTAGRDLSSLRSVGRPLAPVRRALMVRRREPVDHPPRFGHRPFCRALRRHDVPRRVRTKPHMVLLRITLPSSSAATTASAHRCSRPCWDGIPNSMTGAHVLQRKSPTIHAAALALQPHARGSFLPRIADQIPSPRSTS
jgi:hypothetical protein